MCFPQSTWSGSAFLPHRRATSSHLSENAPHMQHSTPRSTRFRIDPSITPQADEVERKTGCFVPNSVCSLGWISRYSFLKSSLRCPIIGRENAAKVLAETSTGPGVKSLSCACIQENVQQPHPDVQLRIRTRNALFRCDSQAHETDALTAAGLPGGGAGPELLRFRGQRTFNQFQCDRRDD